MLNVMAGMGARRNLRVEGASCENTLKFHC